MSHAAGVDAAAVRRVELRDIPLAVLDSYRAHLEAIRACDPASATDEADVRARVEQAMDVLEQRFGRFRAPNEQAVADAVARGASAVTFTYDVPASFAVDVLRLLDALEDVQILARRGHAALPAAPPAVVGFWRWMLGEALGQLDGLEPTPYSAARAAAIVPPRD